MKTGRNDPCPCGSGRKYKNCHLRSAEESSADSLWRRLHELSARLPRELLRFARRRYGAGLIDEAWQEFTLFEEERFDPESIDLPLFLPWFFYDWEPDPAESQLPKAELGGFPLVAAYLQARGRHEDALAVGYLRACRDSCFSFLDLLEVTPGEGLAVRDALSGWEGFVIERTASQTLQKGDIIFAKVVTLDEVSVLDGFAPISFPPREKAPLIELRKKIRKAHPSVTAAVLKDYGLEMLKVYHGFARRLLDPWPPVMQNTDGEPLIFGRVSYEVPSPRAAFDALKVMSLGHTEEELLADAKFDESGSLYSVEIPLLRAAKPGSAMENVGLARIRIEGGRLVAQRPAPSASVSSPMSCCPPAVGTWRPS